MRVLMVSAAMLAAACTAAGAQSLTIGTNPTGSLGHSSGVAVGQLIDETMGRAVSVVPYAGSTVYVNLMNRASVDLGFSNTVELSMSYNGTGVFEGRENPNIRLITVIYPQRISLGVANGSDIDEVSDLLGKRIPSQFTAQAIIGVFQEALLANGGLSMTELDGVPVSNFIDGVEMLGNGRVDAALIPPGTGVAQRANADLSGRDGLRFLSLDDSPEAVERMQAVVPVATVDTMEPAPGLPGIIGPTNVLRHPYWLIGGAHLDEEFVYELVKAMDANKGLLADSFGPFRGFTTEGMHVEHESVPYHPGALRYYREIGVVE